MSYTETKVVGDKEFIRALRKASEDTFKEVHDEAVSIVNDVRNNMIKGMRYTRKNMKKAIPRRYTTNKETGKRKAIRYGKKARFHYPSLPGFPPAIDDGELVGSIMTDVREYELEAGSVAVPHALFTNEGTVKMKARPWLEPSFEGIPIEERLKRAFQRGSGV